MVIDMWLNSKFFYITEKIFDCVYLSLLFLVTCIPIITIGASITSLYYTTQKVIKEDQSHVSREFLGAFKRNFKQATYLWLLVITLALVSIACIFLMRIQSAFNGLMAAFTGIHFVIICVLLVWMVYLFSYLAKFENTTKQIIKNTLIMLIGHLPQSLMIGICLLLVVLAVDAVPVAIIVIPTVAALLLGMVLEKVFSRYTSA